jgi:hypothetical protein
VYDPPQNVDSIHQENNSGMVAIDMIAARSIIELGPSPTLRSEVGDELSDLMLLWLTGQFHTINGNGKVIGNVKERPHIK